MSNLFLANPQVLKQKGIELEGSTQRFNENVEKIYSTVQEMISSAYVSPAAKALGERILSYKDDLDSMTKVIDGYSKYCINASNKVTRNEQNIIDNFKNGGE